MPPIEIFGYIASVFIGLVLGLVGGGGSILTVPVMVYLFSIAPLSATSYSLFIVGASSLAGVLARINTGLVKPKTALLFAASSITTVFLVRKFIIPNLPSVLFNIGGLHITTSLAMMLLFAVLMLSSSVSMIRNKTGNAGSQIAGSMNYLKLILFGIGIGMVTGFLGAGGGFLIVPVLVLLCGLNMKEAIGTSLLIITCNSLVGFLADIGHTDINWKLLGIVTSLAVAGILIGSSLSKKIKNENLKTIFGWFVLIMGVYIIIKELFLNT